MNKHKLWPSVLACHEDLTGHQGVDAQSKCKETGDTGMGSLSTGCSSGTGSGWGSGKKDAKSWTRRRQSAPAHKSIPNYESQRWGQEEWAGMEPGKQGET